MTKKTIPFLAFLVCILFAAPSYAEEAGSRAKKHAIYGAGAGVIVGAMGVGAHEFATGVIANDASEHREATALKPGLQSVSIEGFELYDKRADKVEVLAILNFFRYRF